MSKLIRQLVEQATTIEEYGWGASYANFDQEKFAKLIIFECTKLAVFRGDAATAKAIKEHFGVKDES